MRLTLIFFLLLPWLAEAHQSSLSSTDSKVNWPLLSVPFTINTNSSDLSSSSARTIILNSVSQWNGASSIQLVPTSGSHNNLRFESDFSQYGSGVVGITEVTYNSSGTIQKANILLNDEYQFMDTPGLYSYTQIYLGDVVSHEMGHMLGLSHSEVLDASMFYASFSGQSSLSLDDQAGVRQKYDTNYGTIKGYVKGGSNIGILGAHVQLISRKSGQVVGGFSDEKGRFVIGGLDVEDTYYLYSAPLKNAGSLPSYFLNSQSDFCPGSYVGSFFQQCGHAHQGYPQALNLSLSQPTIDVGSVTINCSLKTSDDYNLEKLESSFSPLVIYDYGIDQRLEKAFVGHFRSSSSSSTWSPWDKLMVDLTDFVSSSGNPTFLTMSLTGRKFGNQLEYEMEVWQNNVLVAGSLRQKVYSASEETWETDLKVTLPLAGSAASNIFEVRIRARRLTTYLISQIFPNFELFSTNRSLPYLLVSSLSESPIAGSYIPLIDTGSVLSDNASCLDAPLSYKVAKSTAPTDSDDNGQRAAAAASCGTIEPPQNGGGGPQAFIVSLGFMLSLLASTVMKRSKKFLS